MRVFKQHQDPRRLQGSLPFEVYQEVERGVKSTMELYIKKRFPEGLSPRKPFHIWKELKDAEEVIKAKILQRHDEHEKEQQSASKDQENVASSRNSEAFKVSPKQRWKVAKDHERRESRARSKAAEVDRTKSALGRVEKAKIEYRAWLHRKIDMSKETALKQRKARLMDQQKKAEYQLKAAERAETHYVEWLRRKQYEDLRKQQESSPKPRVQHRGRQGPVLMAYSANRKSYSKVLMEELSAVTEKSDPGYFSTDRSETRPRNSGGKPEPLYEDVMDSDLGSSDHLGERLQPVRLQPHQALAEEEYDSEEEEESQEARHAASGRNPHRFNFEDPPPVREMNFEDRRKMEWAEAGSSLYSDEDFEGNLGEGDEGLNDSGDEQ